MLTSNHFKQHKGTGLIYTVNANKINQYRY